MSPAPWRRSRTFTMELHAGDPVTAQSDSEPMAGEDPARPPARSGLSAKLLPPTDPAGTLSRPNLEARLADAVGRRLTIVGGGAGFGKSTLAARVAAGSSTAWYTLDAGDRHLASLAAGIVAALRLRVPGLPADLANPVEGSIEPTDDAAVMAQATAAAAMVTDALQAALDGDLVLVLDDLHVVQDAPAAWRFVEALVRLAPPGLHLLVTSRSEVPFGIERLRSQGQVVDIGGGSLAFTVDEIEALVASLVGSAGDVPEAAARIQAATGGWPAAVRLAVEAYRTAPAGSRAAVLDRLQRPEGPIFAYLAEEVVSGASEATRELVQHAVHFDRFSAPLLAAVGVHNPATTLEELARRALFLQPLPGEPGWFALHGLIREYTFARLPLAPDDVRDLHHAAARWFEAEGRLEVALGSQLEARDQPALARFLVRAWRNACAGRGDAPGRRGDGDAARRAARRGHRTGAGRSIARQGRVA